MKRFVIALLIGLFSFYLEGGDFLPKRMYGRDLFQVIEVPKTVYALDLENQKLFSTKLGNEPILEKVIPPVVVNPEDPSTFWVAGRSQDKIVLYKGIDYGKEFLIAEFPGSETPGISQFWLTADPRDFNTLYISTIAYDYGFVSKVYKSVDGGASWKEVPIPRVIGGIDVYALFCDNKGELYFVGSDKIVKKNGKKVLWEDQPIGSLFFDQKTGVFYLAPDSSSIRVKDKGVFKVSEGKIKKVFDLGLGDLYVIENEDILMGRLGPDLYVIDLNTGKRMRIRIGKWKWVKKIVPEGVKKIKEWTDKKRIKTFIYFPYSEKILIIYFRDSKLETKELTLSSIKEALKKVENIDLRAW